MSLRKVKPTRIRNYFLIPCNSIPKADCLFTSNAANSVSRYKDPWDHGSPSKITMGFITSFLSVPLFLTFTYLLYSNIIQRRFRPRLPFPPGPKGLPIVGNLFNTIDTNNKPQPQWIQYLVLGKKYNSDIIHTNVLGDHTVILNSIKHTSELLEKRSALYSGRPGK